MINTQFLQYAITFFGKVAEAKLKNREITADWYAKEFLDPNLPTDDIIIHSGLNKKTVTNMYNSAKREIVLETTVEHYHILYDAINSLIEQGSEIDLTLTVKFRGVSIDLNMNETLIVINTLAVKRAALRGGAWSTTGKQVEKKLMLALCRLYQIPIEFILLRSLTKSGREIDFCLKDQQGKLYQTEVKLMGKGNPESADAVIARNSDIFIADKLSNLNKKQLDELQIQWVELRSSDGHQQFGKLLKKLNIPHTPFLGDLTKSLDLILDDLFS